MRNFKLILRAIILCLSLHVPLLTATAQAQPKPVPVRMGVVKLAPINSQINFVGTHIGFKPDPRKGGFANFTGQVVLNEKKLVKSVNFEIETQSLWTEIPKLTTHLKSPDFFDVRQHTKASFQSVVIATTDETGVYEITGKFTLLGTTKEITFPATISVTEKGLTLVSKFSLDRTLFGMTYGKGRVRKAVAISVTIGLPTKIPSK